MLRDLFLQITSTEQSNKTPATMLIFAHPDDEVIALGARLGRFHSPVLVHVTDGAPRNEQDSRAHGFPTLEEYRRSREIELSHALQLAGLEKAQRVHLQISDQETSFVLSQLGRELSRLFSEYQPEIVFTHPYEGGHPDHDACAFAVHRAAAQMEAKGRKRPLIVEGAFYHAGAQGIETGCFLPHEKGAEEIHFALSPEEQQYKQRLFACFASQRDVLRYFTTERECFRVAPQYDFHQPPHAGTVFYDQYPWGMTSRRFCELACAADLAESMARL
ncbi:MAG: PIG-L deacetylase family protein [Candidatus Sulfotelmatobacter sp.]